MPNYKIKNCVTNEEIFVTSSVLLTDKSYRFNELNCDCFSVVLYNTPTGGPEVTIKGEYDKCSGCADDPCFPLIDVITEDDISLKVYKKLNDPKTLTNINSSIIISDGANEYKLYEYDIPLPDSYVGGYLVYSTVINTPWAYYFPETAINNKITFSSDATGNIDIRLPNLIN